MNLICGIPGPEPLKNRIVEAGSVPGKILGQLNSGVKELQKLGFDQFWHYTSKSSLTGGSGCGIEGLHSSRQVLAKIIYVSFKTRESLVMGFISGFSNEIVLGTTNKKQDFNTPPNHINQRQIGADAPRLWELHRQKLTELGRNNLPQSFASLDEVAAFEDKILQMSYDDKIKRGIWVEMTDGEVALLLSQRLASS